MKKRKVYGSRYEPNKQPRSLKHGGKLDLHEAEIADIIPHLNLEGKDKSDPNLHETKKAYAFPHLIPGGEDKNDPGLKTAAATPIIEPEKPCCKFHPTYRMLCANFALDHYNRENDKSFELVEDETLRCSPLISSYETSYDTSIRCVFNAKDDSSIKEFSAQLDYCYNLGLNVTICKVSVGDDDDLYDENNSAYDSLNPDTPEYTPLSIDFDPDALEKDLRLRNKRIAESALEHYNGKNLEGAKYELNQDVDIENRVFSDTFGGWFHCCFHAVDSSTQQDNLFFAEAKYNYPSKPDVHSCKKLADGPTTRDCWACYPKMQHPANKDGKYHRESPIVQKDTPPEDKTVPHPYDYWDNFGIYEDPRTPSNDGDRCSRDRRIFGIVFANIVLRDYNIDNYSGFKLVEDGSLDNVPKIESSGIISIHCRFIAQQSYSMKRFSAVLKYARRSDVTVASCETEKIPENDEEDCKHENDYAGEIKDIADEQNFSYYSSTRRIESTI